MIHMIYKLMIVDDHWEDELSGFQGLSLSRLRKYFESRFCSRGMGDLKGLFQTITEADGTPWDPLGW